MSAAHWMDLFNEGEHPRFEEPKRTDEEGKARYDAALEYTTDKFTKHLRLWWLYCGYPGT